MPIAFGEVNEVRKRTSAIAVAVVLVVVGATVPAAAEQRPEPGGREPAAAVRDCAEVRGKSGAASPPVEGLVRQRPGMCFRSEKAGPELTAKPPAVANLPDWCVYDQWPFNRFETCMFEHGYLEFYKEVCDRRGCPRIIYTGWMEITVRYHSKSFAFSPYWDFNVSVEGLAAAGDGVNGAILSADFWCNGSCSAIVSDFPQQVLRAGSTVSGHGSFDTGLGGGDQKFGRGALTFTFRQLSGGIPGSHQQVVGPTTRCDSVILVAGPGCVFWEARPTFDLDEGWYPEVANHVRRAQASGLVGGNHVPLSRTMNEEIISNNRAVACPGTIPRPPFMSCDEYPFASTYEGASNPVVTDGGRTFSGCYMDHLPQGATGPLGWSACMVDDQDNRDAGLDLEWFYNNNRVLDQDSFYVDVD